MKYEILTEENVWNYADGIDFCAVFTNKITHSFTKEEFRKSKVYPKNNRKYWYLLYGEKRYLELDKEICKNENGKIYQEI